MTISLRMETDDGHVIGIQREVNEDNLRSARFPDELIKVEFASAVTEFQSSLEAWAATYSTATEG